MNERIWKIYGTGALALLLVQAVLTFASGVNKGATEKEVATALNALNLSVTQSTEISRQFSVIEARQIQILEALSVNLTVAMERQQQTIHAQEELKKKVDEIYLRKK